MLGAKISSCFLGLRGSFTAIFAWHITRILEFGNFILGLFWLQILGMPLWPKYIGAQMYIAAYLSISPYPRREL